eukprot:4558867-Pyramimonas_sp.AAC.1
METMHEEASSQGTTFYPTGILRGRARVEARVRANDGDCMTEAGIVGALQERVRDVGATRKMRTAKQWNGICRTRNNFAVNAFRAMGEAGVRRYFWLTPTRTYSMSTGRRHWPTLPTTQLQLLASWLPNIGVP